MSSQLVAGVVVRYVVELLRKRFPSIDASRVHALVLLLSGVAAAINMWVGDGSGGLWLVATGNYLGLAMDFLSQALTTSASAVGANELVKRARSA